MNNLNSVLLEGTLVKDPFYRKTGECAPLCAFSISSNYFYRQGGELKKEVSYFDIETWSKLAELCRKEGREGRGVRVAGRLKQERWNDTGGTARSKAVIVAEHVEWRPS
jgi:single-strand DNA-binding protein